jgi:hypothetical protein
MNLSLIVILLSLLTFHPSQVDVVRRAHMSRVSALLLFLSATTALSFVSTRTASRSLLTQSHTSDAQHEVCACLRDGSVVTDFIVFHMDLPFRRRLIARYFKRRSLVLCVKRHRVLPMLPISPLDHASRVPLYFPHLYSVRLPTPMLQRRSLPRPQSFPLLYRCSALGSLHWPSKTSHLVKFLDLHRRLEAGLGSRPRTPSHRFRVRLHCSHAQLVLFHQYLQKRALALHLCRLRLVLPFLRKRPAMRVPNLRLLPHSQLYQELTP